MRRCRLSAAMRAARGSSSDSAPGWARLSSSTVWSSRSSWRTCRSARRRSRTTWASAGWRSSARRNGAPPSRRRSSAWPPPWRPTTSCSAAATPRSSASSRRTRASARTRTHFSAASASGTRPRVLDAFAGEAENRSVVRGRVSGVVVALVGLGLFAASPAFGSSLSYAPGPVSDLSTSCSGQNAEVEQAADQAAGNVYEVWMGCRGIAFARSTDGGATFEQPISLPGTVGSNYNTWDPAVTAGPDGTVYAVFMRTKASQWYPVVDASFDHGRTFTQSTELIPPDPKNWGDRPFIAAGANGAVYVTWDYGPDRGTVTELCAANGSCGFATGQLNVVMQRSADHGRSFGAMTYVSPAFPASGADSAPMVVEPSGRIDVLYQGYEITDTTTYSMNPGYSYFTSSTDGGATWSAPVRLGPDSGTMSLDEWR